MSASKETASTAAQPCSIAVVALWFGLLTGLAEAAIVGGLQYAPHRYLLISPDVVWMAPVADAAILLLTALGLGLIARAWPRLISRRVTTFVLAFLSLFSIAFIFHPELYKGAGMLLAAGAAAQIERLITAHSRGFQTWVRRTIAAMLGVILLLSGAVHGWTALREHQAAAKIPPTAADRPNVLLIVLDTVRAQSLSVYGYGRPTTPALEQLARSGIRFERALSTAPWTLTSHASMFTGHFPHELSADWLTPLDGMYPTLAETFSAHGYATAGFVANLGYCSYKNGLERGFAHYEDFRITTGQIIRSASLGRYVTNSRWLRRLLDYFQTLGRKDAAEINREFLDWLPHKGPHPFFAFLNYFDAHAPYDPPPPFDRRFGTRPAGEWNPWMRRGNAPPEEIQAMVDAYDSSIAYLDHQLGLLFEALRTRGLMDNTLVIVAADHGEEFGEHEVFDHGNSLYLPSLHVPLLIALPGRVPAGRTVGTAVTLRDLAATILELTGVQGDVRSPGTSLTRYWDSGAPNADSTLLSEVSWARHVPDWLPVSRGDMKSVVADGWRYIKNGDGREELYDFEHDAAEQHDLAASEAAQEALQSCRAVLNRTLRPHAPD